MKQGLGCLVMPALIGVVLLFIAWTSSSGGSKADAGVRDGILLLGNGAEPASLDPHLATGVTENKIISALLEGLVTDHPDDESKVAPGVAESWESRENARIWTFHLRKNARWSDGSPVTAGDFVYSFQRILSPGLLADYASMLFLLENGEAYNQGNITDFAQVGAKALDDWTLEITLIGPTPHFPGMLKHYTWFPVHRATIERFGGMDNRDSDWTKPGNFVGNGPFLLKRRALREVVEVEKNPGYWDAATVRLNGIHFYPIDNSFTEERAFLNGGLHYAYSPPLTSIPKWIESKDPRFHSDPYYSVYFYRVNTTRPPLDDPRVRRALALAIDRVSITRDILRGGQMPAKGMVPDSGDYHSPGGLGTEVEEARALLAEAGFPGGKGMRPLEILINTSESHRTMAEAIQEMWKRDLGLTIRIRSQDWNVYLDKQSKLDFDIARAGWTGDFLDPSTFLDLWEGKSGNNQTGWKNAEFDALLGKARTEVDEPARIELLRQAEGVFLKELPALPIYVYTRQYLLDPRVSPWPKRMLDNRAWKTIGFSDPASPAAAKSQTAGGER